jgi:hypothetical protein
MIAFQHAKTRRSLLPIAKTPRVDPVHHARIVTGKYLGDLRCLHIKKGLVQESQIKSKVQESQELGARESDRDLDYRFA